MPPSASRQLGFAQPDQRRPPRRRGARGRARMIEVEGDAHRGPAIEAARCNIVRAGGKSPAAAVDRALLAAVAPVSEKVSETLMPLSLVPWTTTPAGPKRAGEAVVLLGIEQPGGVLLGEEVKALAVDRERRGLVGREGEAGHHVDLVGDVLGGAMGQIEIALRVVVGLRRHRRRLAHRKADGARALGRRIGRPVLEGAELLHRLRRGRRRQRQGSGTSERTAATRDAAWGLGQRRMRGAASTPEAGRRSGRRVTGRPCR